MDPIEKLAELFKQFPGIGTRQAHRFAFFLLKKNDAYIHDLQDGITALRNQVTECTSCHRYFVRDATRAHMCWLCRSSERDNTTLLIVEKDVDLDAIESSGAYKGRYFVLGGTLPVMNADPDETIRLSALVTLIGMRAEEGLREIIIATAFTPESEHTADIVRARLQPLAEEKKITLTTLGRGLSTGSELEYADRDTLRYALEGRK